ncbi:transcription elongation factor GreAB [Croceicoccus estronivorus]|uniref:nucleoside diphosphate kinase regulator n=1 Tax=Croceicoccus estronivorus TaxID=1172626 RepID=UPI00082B253A|nr:nucleoside diphosphate kinase regulator [Croceicoccus estronivorus]OCC23876.1 transcription elongation factor GreAB [Croceicoccus estronivorus]
MENASTAPARKPSSRPPIKLCESDADTLSELAMRMESRQPQLAAMLMAEIDRAKIVPDARLPKDVVAMGATVRFSDETAGTERVAQLVYPHQADLEAGRISVLTPVGAGLIGLREGQSIRWKDRDSHERIFRIIEVVPAAR